MVESQGISEMKEGSRRVKLLWEYMPHDGTVWHHDYIADLWPLMVSLEVADKADLEAGS